MSKIFYDRLISLEEVEIHISKVAKSSEEKEELWDLVDSIVHHKVIGAILGKLPQTSHQEFLDKFHKAPYDETLFDYLKEKIGPDVEELIRAEIGDLAYEILKELKTDS